MIIVEGCDPVARRQVCQTLAQTTESRVIGLGAGGPEFTVADEATFATVYTLLKEGFLRTPLVFNTFYPTRDILRKRANVRPIVDANPNDELPSHTVVYLAVSAKTMSESTGLDFYLAKSLVKDYEEYMGGLDHMKRVNVVHIDQESLAMDLSDAALSLSQSGVLTPRLA